MTMKKLPWLYIILGLGGAAALYYVYKKRTALIQQAGTAVSSTLIDVLHRPGGTTNTALQAQTDYENAVAAIIAANPQYTPDHVKKLLVYYDWLIGQPMPQGSGLIAPAGM